MIQSSRLQLGDDHEPYPYIITGNEWFKAWVSEWRGKSEFIESTGNAIIYPEHDLLWIGVHEDKTERFKTLEDFEREFSSLPRWEATRYAVLEHVSNYDDERDADGDLRVVSYALISSIAAQESGSSICTASLFQGGKAK